MQPAKAYDDSLGILQWTLLSTIHTCFVRFDEDHYDHLGRVIQQSNQER